jgi:TonB family protein
MLLSGLLAAAVQSVATPMAGGAAANAINAPLPVPATRAQANLPRLFSADDYPRSALQSGEKGTVTVMVWVDRDGRVSMCAPIENSGSPSLDRTTCSIIQRRARFTPARDSSGAAVADRVVARIKWDLPSRPTLTLENRYDRIVLTHDKRATISACRAESSNAAMSSPPESLCRFGMITGKQMETRYGKKFTFAERELVLQSGVMVGGRDAARGVGKGPGEKLVTMTAVALTIDADGMTVKCVPADGNMVGPVSPCAQSGQLKFDPLAPAATERSDRHAVVYQASFTRPIR